MKRFLSQTTSPERLGVMVLFGALLASGCAGDLDALGEKIQAIDAAEPDTGANDIAPQDAGCEQGKSCDDGDKCTENDACKDGKCAGTAKKCDDGNNCTTDACKDGACGFAANTEFCEDGNVCTKDDQCKDGKCAAGPLDDKKCKCDSDEHCAQGDDGNPCNGTLFCDKSGGQRSTYACKVDPKTVVDCTGEKVDECEQSACSEKSGKCEVADLPDGVTCSDGKTCSIGDNCKAGECKPTAENPCDDGSVCTKDNCNQLLDLCKNDQLTDCDDGDKCTKNDTCAGTKCVGGKALSCDDGNKCTADSCDKAKGCVNDADGPTGEPCEDGDKCTDNDACKSGTCEPGKAPDCDDGNDCTTDSCDKQAGCVNSAKEGTCDDGDACTADDACDKGKCKGGATKGCDDNNPCTDDSCDKKAGCANTNNTAACDDGDPCTSTDLKLKDGKDQCAKGKCVSGAPTCVCEEIADCKKFEDGNPCNGTLYCDKSGKEPACKVDPKTEVKCDAGGDTFCAQNTCDPKTGKCASKGINDAKGCDDNDKCSLGTTCSNGACAGGKKLGCDDNEVCTTNTCDKAKGCVFLPNQGTCTDSDVCTEGDKCAAKACTPGATKTCDDQNPCTTDKCDPKDGCGFKPNTDSCDDADACTTSSACEGGVCKGTAKATCDDKNACTDDSCDAKLGCQYAANSAKCEDGNLCTKADGCSAKTCVPGKLDLCDDNNACTKDACDPATGKCSNIEDGKVCVSCSKNGDADCPQDAKAPCTENKCQPNKTCAPQPKSGTCDDGNKCTGTAAKPDACANAKCAPGAAKDCDDKNVCTDDACKPESGCVYTHNADKCDDDSKCTTVDQCALGKCAGSEAPDCDDKNVCTDDSCTPADGCVNKHNTTVCDDGSKCTGTKDKPDTCAAGKCAAGATVDCGDAKVCTDDKCDATAGCLNPNNAASCDDNDKCSAESACSGGLCKAGKATDCDDANSCTVDSCDKAAGCQKKNVADGVACKIGGSDGKCDAGACKALGEDLDHDGLSGSADPCPTVWNPDGDKGACPVWSGTGWTGSQPVNLSQDGKASVWRRTNEPVEIPLVNGISDSSIVGYWSFDDTFAGVGSDKSVVSGKPGFADSPLSGGDKAVDFAGKPDGVQLAVGRAWRFEAEFSIGLWLRFDAPNPLDVTTNLITSTTGTTCHDKGVFLQWRKGSLFGGVLWGGGAGDQTRAEAPFPVDKLWHHVTLTFQHNATAALFIDGKLAAASTKKPLSSHDCGNPLSVGFIHANSGKEADHIDGAMDDLVVHQRALTPAEIATYVTSMAPYGSTFAPGAQADFDDVRVTESTDGGKTHHGTHFEVVGVRPHSDTDLEGVVAYWKLDGDGKDVAGNHNGTNKGAAPTVGRFGDANGALGSAATGYIDTGWAPTFGSNDSFTVECWARLAAAKKQALWGFTVDGEHSLVFDVRPTDLNINMRAQGPGEETQLQPAVAVGGTGWRHFAVVRDAVAKKVRVYVDGLEVAAGADKGQSVNQKGMNFFIGAYNNKGSAVTLLDGAIDDVIIHKVAKTPDYLAKRARGLPRVRFLAHTADKANSGGTFDFHKYELRWGNAAAKAVPTALVGLDKSSKCGAILSPCLGYAGRWRLNEGAGTVAVDESADRNHGGHVGTPSWAATNDGVGLKLSTAGKTGVAIAKATSLDLAQSDSVTVEVAFSPTPGWTNVPLLFTTAAGDKALNQLYLVGGDVHFQMRGANNDQGADAKHTIGTPAAGTWYAMAARWDAQSTTAQLFLAGSAVGTPSKLAQSGGVSGKAYGIGYYPGSSDGHFDGVIGGVRMMKRGLEPDELLHYPLAQWSMKAESPPVPLPPGDLDHDGLAGSADKCPTVWSPDNAEVCAEWTGQGWTKSQDVGLGQPDGKGGVGESTWRRTNEPVEVPLVNGIIDASVRLHLALDANLLDSGSHGSTAVGALSAWVAGPAGMAKAWAMASKANALKTSAPWLAKTTPTTLMAWYRGGSNTSDELVPLFTMAGTTEGKWDYMNLEIASDGKLDAKMVAAGNLAWSMKFAGGSPTQWHHVAWVLDPKAGSRLYFDGRLAASHDKPVSWSIGSNDLFVGRYAPDNHSFYFKGAVDEVVLVNRALSPAEIATYVASKAPYGSTFAPGAQADFDDVRVTEQAAWDKAPHATHFEVVGARPHSDTDLEGVVAYWKLDGDGKELLSGKTGVAKVSKPAIGRFGDTAGGVEFTGSDSKITVKTADLGGSPVKAAGTLEAWFHTNKSCGSDHQTIIKDGSPYSFGFLILEPGNGEQPCGIAFSTTAGMIWAPGKLESNRWYHAAVVWGAGRVQLYLDGIVRGDTKGKIGVRDNPEQFGGSTGAEMYIGAYAGGEAPFDGVIDEIIIHNTAKSADYIAKRARGLPRVRFLAHTADKASSGGAFDFHKYELHWGNPAAKAVPTALVGLDKTSKCDAILSPCLGYAGWWRLNEATGTIAIDDSANRNHGQHVGTPAWAASNDGVGLKLSTAGKTGVAIAKATSLDLAQSDSATVEVAFSPTPGWTNVPLLFTTAAGDKALNQLYLVGGDVHFQMRGANNTQGADAKHTIGTPAAGTWYAMAARWDAQNATAQLFLAGSAVGTPSKLAQSGGVSGKAYGIGYYPGSADGHFDGVIDGVRMVKRGLEPDELLHYPLAAWSMKAPPPPKPAQVVIDDFDRADSATIGNGWTEKHGDFRLADGRAVSVSGACSKHAAIGKDIGYRSTFDLRIKVKTDGNEIGFDVNSGAPADGCGYPTKRGLGVFLATKTPASGIRLYREEAALPTKEHQVPTGVDIYVRLRFDGSALATWIWKVGDAMPATPQHSVATTASSQSVGSYLVINADHVGSYGQIYVDEVMDLAP